MQLGLFVEQAELQRGLQPSENGQRPSIVGAMGVSLVEARMLSHGIVPCRPAVDIGFDIVSICGKMINRVQVKTTESPPFEHQRAYFSVRRYKTGRTRQDEERTSATYTGNEFDVFVFVDSAIDSCFVVPVDRVNLRSHKVSFSTDSVWREAWGVLKPQ